MTTDESTNSGPVDFSEVTPSASSELDSLLNSGEQETTTPADPSTEKEQTETAPSQEGENTDANDKVPEAKSDTPDATKEVPLHKDSRFQEVQREKEFLRSQLAEQKAMIDNLMQLAKPKTQENEEIPKEFLQAYGTGDEESDKKAWGAFKPVMDMIKNQVFTEMSEKQARAQQEAHQFDSWVEGQVSTFQGQGLQISKDEFVEIIKEFEPSNGLKSYDPEKVLKLHNLKKELAELKVAKEKEKGEQKHKAKKAIASLSSTKQPTSEAKEFFTLDDSPSWKSRLKSSLKG